jgi:hypothetical protein
MRRVILVATLAALTAVPLAYAQTQAPVTAPPASSMAAPATPMAAPDPNNCGTPDQPKPCPPMPRHAMKHYHANKKSSG